MGDNHFLLQNTLSGLVFFAFSLASLWGVDQDIGTDVITFIFDKWQSLALIIFSPIIGILIQGIWMFVAYFDFRSDQDGNRHPYRDESRELLAQRIRTAIQSLDALPREIKEKFNHLPNDSLFVWLYYSDGSPEMIEWVRRRRDFQHIGENWISAAILGLPFGALVALFIREELHNNLPIFLSLLAVTVISWSLGLFFLRNKMKEDADTTELVWVCAYLYPQIKEQIRASITRN